MLPLDAFRSKLNFNAIDIRFDFRWRSIDATLLGYGADASRSNIRRDRRKHSNLNLTPLDVTNISAVFDGVLNLEGELFHERGFVSPARMAGGRRSKYENVPLLSSGYTGCFVRPAGISRRVRSCKTEYYFVRELRARQTSVNSVHINRASSCVQFACDVQRIRLPRPFADEKLSDKLFTLRVVKPLRLAML